MTNHIFIQKMKGTCRADFLQEMKGAAQSRAIYFLRNMKGSYRADFHSKTEGALATRYWRGHDARAPRIDYMFCTETKGSMHVRCSPLL